MYSLDLALSQDVLKSKGTVSLAVNDVFNTMRFGIDFSSPNQFQSTTRRKRESQVATLTFAYRFGSLDNISRKRANSNGGGGQGGGDYGF